MKKVSLILLVALALFVLVACNSAETTYTSPRWDDYEVHTFEISKASSPEVTEIYNGNTYLKEPSVSNYENLENAQELEYEDVKGTYTMTIAVDRENKLCNFSTKQVLYVKYSTALLQGFDAWNTANGDGVKLSDKVVPYDNPENPFASADGYTVLKSTTETNVVFKNDASQRPFSSENHVDGFYIGQEAQEVSEYDLVTSYDWTEKGKVTISVNGQEQSTTGTYSSGKFIDANQILLYVRSLDKTSSSFKDSPSVTIFMPLLDKAVSASFVFTYDCLTLVDNAGETVHVNLNAIGVVVEGTALLVQLNVPETVNSDNKALDCISNVGSVLDKYTTLRFRSGRLSYRLTSWDTLTNGAAILDAVTVKSSS